jgi:hypothetical protein
MIQNAIPGFSPIDHGFAFPNSWEPGTPVLEIPTPFGRIPVGDASGGVCGGMVFAAADFYFFRKHAPKERSPELFRYLCKRLIESWSLPFGVMRYYDWQRRPGASKSLWGTAIRKGVTRLTVVDEWPKIQRCIDSGLPAPLGLVKVQSYLPHMMAQNHQVLGFGYAYDGQTLRYDCYDPNWPGHTVTLTVDTTAPDDERLVEHSDEGQTCRGVFLTDYVRPVETQEWVERMTDGPL